VIYSITDRAGNYSEAKRVIEVVANINRENYSLQKSVKYPSNIEDVTYILAGLFADSQGGEIEYNWTFNQESSLSTNSLNNYTTSLSINSYQLVVIASNLDDTEQFTLDFEIYPPCPTVANGNFEDAIDVAPWLWDIDIYWSVPGGFSGWSNTVQDASSNYKERKEQITEIADGKGINGSKAAVICDTTEDTGVFWGTPDIQESSGLLYTSITTIQGPQYKFRASVFRGENCSTPISCTLKSNVDLDIEKDGTQNLLTVDIPSTTGWNEIEIIFMPESETDLSIEFFKGTDWTNSDKGEVRFDGITLSYNN